MKFEDKLYTEISIQNPIIESLVYTKPFQRLKEINQYGGVNFVFPDKYQVSRFEHSLGVYNVLNTLGADLEVLVAGLLHDVGHTAFSHLFDMARSNTKENFHEQVIQNLEGWDEIQNILEQNGIPLKDVDQYNLIKKSLPDIGADRFDYALRDFMFATNSKFEFAGVALEDLERDDEGIYFKNLEIAEEFARTGNEAMWYVIYEPKVVAVYQSIIDIVRQGLSEGWLTESDFFGTDIQVFDKFRKNFDKVPQKYSRVFIENYRVEEVKDENDADLHFVKLKARYFDPRVKTVGGMKAVSELSSDYKLSLEETKNKFNRAKEGIYYKIIFD